LEKLEGRSREEATARLREAWAALTDQEIAELLFPYTDWVPNSEPNPEERELEKRARDAMPEELIAAAIGLKEGMESEEIDRRVGVLNRKLGVFERGDNIRRHMLALGEGRRSR
jgi:hypothetical protein